MTVGSDNFFNFNQFPQLRDLKSLIKILDQNALEYLASEKGFILDRIRDARIFGAVRAENKSKKIILCRVATKITYGVNLNKNL